MDLKILFILGVFASGLPAEPPEEFLVNAEVDNSTGFYVREYAVLSDQINYVTARQIVFQEEPSDFWIDTVKYPLFYWFDWNGDGYFGEGEMFIDRKVEGCVCDIQPYQVWSP